MAHVKDYNEAGEIVLVQVRVLHISPAHVDNTVTVEMPDGEQRDYHPDGIYD